MHKTETDPLIRVPRQQIVEREEHSRLGVLLVIALTIGFWTSIILAFRSC